MSAAVDLARHELLGLPCRVVASAHAPYVGLEGRVVDETMRTLTLDAGGQERTVPKAGQAFEFTLPDGSTQRLDGRSIAFRPEERTKKARPARPRNDHAIR